MLDSKEEGESLQGSAFGQGHLYLVNVKHIIAQCFHFFATLMFMF